VAGTCLEYGLRDGALSESCVTDPITTYGLAKDALRRSLYCQLKKSSASFIWARLFYLYGDCPGRRTLFMQIKEAVKRGDSEFAMSAGEQLRDYLPVEEVAAQLVALSVAPSAYGIYNVCSGRPISVRRLVEQWIAEHGWTISPKLGVYPYPSYEPLAFWGDDRRIRSLMYPET
jgi:dTDP-6-deoxy-L-talose 4-dehydrogenase (NAD+)